MKNKQYPQGKLREDDDGAIEMKIGVYKGKVVIEFANQVKWFGMNADEAIQMGMTLIASANDAKTGKVNQALEVLVIPDPPEQTE